MLTEIQKLGNVGGQAPTGSQKTKHVDNKRTRCLSRQPNNSNADQQAAVGSHKINHVETPMKTLTKMQQ